MDRPQRLLAIIAVLQTGRQTTAADLAEQFDVSKRTILRDIDALAEADVPVIAERGRGGGISLVYGADIDVTRLSDREAEALGLVGVDVARARELGLEAATRSAARKLSTRAPWPVGAEHKGMTKTTGLGDLVAIDTTGWFDAGPSIDAGPLVEALRRGRRLSLRYRPSGQSDAADHTVDPYGLYSRGGRWYLIADVEGDPRMFALSRVHTWRELGEPKRVRDDVTLAEVADHLVTRLETRHAVVVTAVIDAAAEDLVRRILGSRLLSLEPSVGLEPSDDDDRRWDETVTITVGYEELDGVRQLIQFTDHIEILEPLEARNLVHRLTSGMAARHDDGRP
ncbi:MULTISPECIES: WYL domain-containing protein [unclassified Brevibacterium]|uniref:helix-turn-helix transcriptional regulator n=1 Tax=unclassified Brevibacterium TaxID=2614124 RepID=UPI0010F77AF0|nr:MULTISPECIES: WYL domain-containing protein [unclassified Brevibacterium]MCM1011542.1 WYL domain-containing protein [Brevibacterium sp. XM4083]